MSHILSMSFGLPELVYKRFGLSFLKLQITDKLFTKGYCYRKLRGTLGKLYRAYSELLFPYSKMINCNFMDSYNKTLSLLTSYREKYQSNLNKRSTNLDSIRLSCRRTDDSVPSSCFQKMTRVFVIFTIFGTTKCSTSNSNYNPIVRTGFVYYGFRVSMFCKLINFPFQ